MSALVSRFCITASGSSVGGPSGVVRIVYTVRETLERAQVVVVDPNRHDEVRAWAQSTGLV